MKWGKICEKLKNMALKFMAKALIVNQEIFVRIRLVRQIDL